MSPEALCHTTSQQARPHARLDGVSLDIIIIKQVFKIYVNEQNRVLTGHKVNNQENNFKKNYSHSK